MQITDLSIERLNEDTWLCKPVAPSLLLSTWVRRLTHEPPEWLTDCVMVANKVMLVVEEDLDTWQIRSAIAQTLTDMASASHQVNHHQFIVDTKHALDLDEVLTKIPMSANELYTTLSEIEFVVSANGFAPGFAYLSGMPKVLQLPRKATPRTVVPAGSFAIASEYAAIYPKQSPGGWYLLGHCEQTLFDLNREPPNVLQLGDKVRFDFVGCYA